MNNDRDDGFYWVRAAGRWQVFELFDGVWWKGGEPIPGEPSEIHGPIPSPDQDPLEDIKTTEGRDKFRATTTPE